ncbi:MAG: type II secretion system F family protein [Candidatus Micrarchaeia archaeon]
MNLRMPLFIVKEAAIEIANMLPTLSEMLKDSLPSLNRDLDLLDADIDAGRYMIAATINSLLWGVLFGAMIFLLAFSFEKNIADSILPGVASGIIVFGMFLGVFFVYPSILLKKNAEEIDSQLTYALNDMIMQVAAGISLTEAIRKVSSGKYGKVSEEFRKVIEKTISGNSLEYALIEVAQRNKSEFMRRVLWQLATVTHTGASLKTALDELLKGIRAYQNNRIREYSQKLNFYILLYLMVAVVLPSLTILLLTTISVFVSRGGTVHIGRVALTLEQIMIMMTFVYIAAQVAIVEYIRVKRPLL